MGWGLSRRLGAVTAVVLCASALAASAALGAPALPSPPLPSLPALLAVPSVSLVPTAPSTPSQPRRPAASLSSLEQGVLADINLFRTQHRLVALRLSTALTNAAREHSQQMASVGYFAHESADGSAFWKRIQRFYTSSPWRYWSVGDNLLWSSPDVDAAGPPNLRPA